MAMTPSDHLQPWLEAGRLSPVPQHQFDSLLSHLAGSELGLADAWSGFPTTNVRLDNDDLFWSVAQSAVGRYRHAVVALAEDLGVVGFLPDVIMNIDHLCWLTPGQVFFCGYDKDEDRIDVHALAMYDGRDTLFLTVAENPVEQPE